MATKGEMFAGLTVAIITPFKNGEVDYDALRKIVDWHVAEGTDCLAPCGTTGESPTLNHDEHEKVVATVCEYARGRIKVIDHDTIQMTLLNLQTGQDAVTVEWRRIVEK